MAYADTTNIISQQRSNLRRHHLLQLFVVKNSVSRLQLWAGFSLECFLILFPIFSSAYAAAVSWRHL